MSETGALRELNVQPGDVVEWLEAPEYGEMLVIDCAPVWEGTYEGQIRANLKGYGSGIFANEQFRIISRAKSTPDLAAENERLRDHVRALLTMLDALITESGRSIEYGGEDPFRMGEWFEADELAQIEQARAAMLAARVQP